MPNANKINAENRFNAAPRVNTPRSTFNMPKDIRTTFNAGKLIPFYVNTTIMPGDTFNIKTAILCRQSTPIYPTMDNSFLDYFYFFIPHRLVWDHWKEFWGENSTGSWVQQTVYKVPRVNFSNQSPIQKGDIADYFGICQNIYDTNGDLKIMALPFRAYATVWNEFFRDENFAAPMRVMTEDTNTTLTSFTNIVNWGTYNSTFNNRIYLPTKPAPVYKYKDYFNACLPDTQKNIGGGQITLPIGQTAPIILTNYDTTYDLVNTGFSTATEGQQAYISTAGGTNTISYNQGTATNTGMKLEADLANAVAATINAQRYAFALQRIGEASARGGSRYFEIINSLFKVQTNDSRLQRPELLGARQIPITMHQVAQTSSTDNTSPQGNLAAFSLTVDTNHSVTKSFTEHGTLLGVLCVRTQHSYSQGIPRQFCYSGIYDWFHPQFNFLGEQAILNKEIFAANGGTATNDQTFGFNERFAELRYETNVNSGAFSTAYANSLDAWHYGDLYTQLPVLSDQWRRETETYIDRTLAVTSQQEDQFIANIHLDIQATRPVALWAIPGLMDHC